jgi:hypothetical protein
MELQALCFGKLGIDQIFCDKDFLPVKCKNVFSFSLNYFNFPIGMDLSEAKKYIDKYHLTNMTELFLK